MGAACLTYTNGNEGIMCAGIAAVTGTNWYNAIVPYINDTSSATLPKLFTCPRAGIKAGSNHYSGMPSIFAQTGRAAPARMICANQTERRADLVLLFDGTQDSTFSNNARQVAFNTSGYDRYLGGALDAQVVVNGAIVKDGTGFYTAWRHRGDRCNFVFGDGHVTSHRFNQGLTYRELEIVRGGRKWEWEAGIP